MVLQLCRGEREGERGVKGGRKCGRKLLSERRHHEETEKTQLRSTRIKFGIYLLGEGGREGGGVCHQQVRYGRKRREVCSSLETHVMLGGSGGRGEEEEVVGGRRDFQQAIISHQQKQHPLMLRNKQEQTATFYEDTTQITSDAN